MLRSSVWPKLDEKVLSQSIEVFQDQKLLELALHRAELMLEHCGLEPMSHLPAVVIETTQQIHQSLLHRANSMAQAEQADLSSKLKHCEDRLAAADKQLEAKNREVEDLKEELMAASANEKDELRLSEKILGYIKKELSQDIEEKDQRIKE